MNGRHAALPTWVDSVEIFAQSENFRLSCAAVLLTDYVVVVVVEAENNYLIHLDLS